MENEVKQLQQLQGYKHHSFNITKYRNGGESALSVSLKPFLPPPKKNTGLSEFHPCQKDDFAHGSLVVSVSLL